MNLHANARLSVKGCVVKLGARDRAQLIVLAYQSGLVLADKL